MIADDALGVERDVCFVAVKTVGKDGEAPETDASGERREREDEPEFPAFDEDLAEGAVDTGVRGVAA